MRLEKAIEGPLLSPLFLAILPQWEKNDKTVTIATNLIGGLQVSLQPEGGAHLLNYESQLTGPRNRTSPNRKPGQEIIQFSLRRARK